MKKKIVRLTESDLHRIVENSVKRALNELDWKTNMNAARKREAQGKHDQAKELEKYANQKFSEKHGLDNGYLGNENNDNNFNVSMERGTVKNRMNGGKLNKYSYDNNQTWNSDTPDAYRADRNFNDRLGKATSDMRGYYNKLNQSEYRKGKGWDE